MKNWLKWVFFVPALALFIVGLLFIMKNIWLSLICFLGGSLLWGGFASRSRASSSQKEEQSEAGEVKLPDDSSVSG